MTTIPQQPATERTPLSTGVEGLDDVLRGGFTPDRLHLIEGVPGSGKTTLALQFLIEGARRGERVLYVTLSETEEELRAVSASHGWDLEGVHIHELVAPDARVDGDMSYTMFHPSEVELNQTTQVILSEVERLAPSRIVFDSLSEVRLLAGTSLRYRRQILALKRYFAGRNCTVLLLDDLTATDRDLQVQSIAHGVLLLDLASPDYGAERRRVRVVKYRGLGYRGGYHDYVIRRGGVEVFPRLVAAEHRQRVIGERMSSDLPELDRLLGGGIERGTTTLIAGAAGTGKSSLAAQFVAAAAARGQRAAMFVFDETLHSLVGRAASLGIPLQRGIDSGLVTIRPVDPAELSPGEFAHTIRRSVERDHAAIVVIDSLNGYLQAMPDERFLVIQLHELMNFLNLYDVATVMISAHQGLIGPRMDSQVEATYLADAVVLLRYFEAAGEVRQAISIIKKRGGEHERTIREFRLEKGGIRVGDPLRGFRGVLTGAPDYDGEPGSLLDPSSGRS